MNESENHKISKKERDFDEFRLKWRKEFKRYLPKYLPQIESFLEDSEYGLAHSYEVWRKALEIFTKLPQQDKDSVNLEIIELIAVFHDIGKFFQSLHTLENINISEEIFRQYGVNKKLSKEKLEVVIDGIRGSDFYNKRLDPSSNPPTTLEGEIVRAADKMLQNIVKKVDRYWYEYGEKRGAIFFDPNISFEERARFSFDNFLGDQLNVILSLIGLRPEDFSHPVIQEEYRRWSIENKEKVITRILELADEIGESKDNIEKIRQIINWYRETFNC